ncbi:MAG: hypothetical protein WEB06_15655 [Actinomycetota bacterium]
MDGRDPGWKSVLKLYGRGLLPWNVLRRRATAGLTRLTQIRAIWLSLVTSLFLFFFVLNFLIPWEGDPGPFPSVIVLMGTVSLASVYSLRRRPLTGSTSETLLESFMQRFFVSFAFSEATVLFGFVCVFLREVRWLYLVGLPFGLIGMTLGGPLRGNIENYDRMLRSRGTPLRLSELLTQPVTPPEKPGA